MPEVGKRYKVWFDDCCVGGEFTATVTAIEHDGEYISHVSFDNGVRLWETGEVLFTEVANES